MNNYCTNCRKKLNKDELVCQNCNTPIIDLPYNYIYRSPRSKKIIRRFIIFPLIIISLLILGYIIKVEFLKTKYVKAYVHDNYPNQKYSIRYESSGKCIVSGDCYINIGLGCDHYETCTKYKYLDRFKCRSYFYSVTINEEDITVTVFKKDGKYSVVEGRNIYGIKEDDEYDDDDDDDDDFDNTNANESDNITVSRIKNYPYESYYFSFNNGSTKNQISLDDHTTLCFFTGISSPDSKIHISGYIWNPDNYDGNVVIRTKYYDKDYHEIGICNDDITLLGKGHSHIDFSCQISNNDLKDNKTSNDIKYYKIFIDEFNV